MTFKTTRDWMSRTGAVVIAGAAALAAGAIGSADAKQFKYGGFFAVTNFEPMHNVPEVYGFLNNMVEPLTQIDGEGNLIPQLAEKWEWVEDTRWRFHLRKNVKFHDGDDFNADDVLFTYKRAQHPNATMGSPLARIKDIVKVDDYTIDVITKAPNPITGQDLARVPIMSKEWTIKNGAENVASRTGPDESYATRHVNGTGPFKLKEINTGVSLEMVPNPDWWGGKRTDAMTSAKYFTITSGATLVAALLSGEIDLAVNLPPDLIDRLEKSPGVKVGTTRNTMAQFVTINSFPNEPYNSNIKGKNPLKDIRVRQAIYYAIDVDAIIEKIHRGYAFKSDMTIAPQTFGWSKENDVHEPADPAKAKKLLAEAGYPNGFEIGLTSPTGYYPKADETVQAIVAMLAQVGIKVRLNLVTRPVWSAACVRPKFSCDLYLHSSASVPHDAGSHLELLYRQRFKEQDPSNGNGSALGSPEQDELIRLQGIEKDKAKRLELMTKAFAMARERRGYIPLYQPAIIWAWRDTIETPVDPLNRVWLSDVKVK